VKHGYQLKLYYTNEKYDRVDSACNTYYRTHAFNYGAEQMRIDNPTKEDIWKGGTLHFHPLKIEGPQPLGLPYPAIACLEREDTLEPGDEFTRSDGANRRIMAIVDGWAMYRVLSAHPSVHVFEVTEIMKYQDFKITKKHNDPA
jgi:hypothetical protein